MSTTSTLPERDLIKELMRINTEIARWQDHARCYSPVPYQVANHILALERARDKLATKGRPVPEHLFRVTSEQLFPPATEPTQPTAAVPRHFSDFMAVMNGRFPDGAVKIQDSFVWEDGTVAVQQVDRHGHHHQEFEHRPPPADEQLRLSVQRDYWTAKLKAEEREYGAYRGHYWNLVPHTRPVNGPDLLNESEERMKRYHKKLAELSGSLPPEDPRRTAQRNGARGVL